MTASTVTQTEHPMIPKPALAQPRSGIDVALSELIAAVDRRIPYAESGAEIRVATIAAALRTEAVSRLAELRRAEQDPLLQDEALVDAIMTDDGGPAPAAAPTGPGLGGPAEVARASSR